MQSEMNIYTNRTPYRDVRFEAHFGRVFVYQQPYQKKISSPSIPNDLNAAAPPERRGLRRDYVRLMVSDRVTGESVHTRFEQIVNVLQPGEEAIRERYLWHEFEDIHLIV